MLGASATVGQLLKAALSQATRWRAPVMTATVQGVEALQALQAAAW